MINKILLTIFLLSTVVLNAQIGVVGGGPSCTPAQSWEEHWGFYFERESGKLFDNKCKDTTWTFEDAELVGQFVGRLKLPPYGFATKDSAERIKALFERHVKPELGADIKVFVKDFTINTPAFRRTVPERQICYEFKGKALPCGSAGLMISSLIRTPFRLWVEMLKDDTLKAMAEVE